MITFTDLSLNDISYRMFTLLTYAKNAQISKIPNGDLIFIMTIRRLFNSRFNFHWRTPSSTICFSDRVAVQVSQKVTVRGSPDSPLGSRVRTSSLLIETIPYCKVSLTNFWQLANFLWNAVTSVNHLGLPKFQLIWIDVIEQSIKFGEKGRWKTVYPLCQTFQRVSIRKIHQHFGKQC